MLAIRKYIAVLLAVFQTFLINIGIKKPEMKSTPVSPTAGEGVDFCVPDKSESDLYSTVEYASGIKNLVQCSYSDAERSSYIITNSDIVLTHKLKGVEKTATLCDKSGNEFIKDSFKSFYTDITGVKHYFEESFNDGRVNTIRLGEYYYDCNIRDMNYGSFKVNKNFHIYGDKLYMEYDLLANRAKKVPSNFGSEIAIDASKVTAVQIKDKNGIHSSLDETDASTVEYVAFNIDGAGTLGFIVPSDGSTSKLTVKKSSAEYIVTQLANLSPYSGINKYDETGKYDVYKIGFGCRIYTDKTGEFDLIQKEAQAERNPLTVSLVDNNANAVVIGYEPLRGTYCVQMDGTGFVYAYDNPDFRYFVKLKINGDALDRKIYIRTTTPNSGCLECGVLLDKNGLLMPVDVEVCKNFMGDGGDNEYSYKDYCYGDTFTPIYIESGSEKEFTVVNLYQNWGNFPLKQLSSIEFHISYYHLSTGTTESNCIAPYFVFDRDGWTLPDFRNASGKIWDTQPQFNSVGILKFMTYRDGNYKKPVLSEFTGSNIKSYGPTYADVVDYYTSDDGKYTYSLEHTEFPQTDENRTYYTLNVDFNDTVSFDNFRQDFDLFYFDGRFVAFDKTSFLDENNNHITASVSSETTYHTLGSEYPYWGFYKVNRETEHCLDDMNCGCNFAMLIKDSCIIANGKEADIPFAFRESGNSEITQGCLTLDTGKITFTKGDSIKINLILLPWGTGRETDDSTVLSVREDSCIKPLTVCGGTADSYIPEIKAIGNYAQFTVKGGKGNNTVKVDGFTSMKKPVVEIFKDGEWKDYPLSSKWGYDGYMIRTNSDNTYSVSFVYKAENPDTEYTFRIHN